MRLPIATLEKIRIQRLIFSIRTSTVSMENIASLMEKIFEKGGKCFDLPTIRHLESIRGLRETTGDETLIGFGHVGAEAGVSLVGKPLHQFESKVVSTMIKNIVPPESVRKLFPARSFDEVLTQKEIDRMVFDRSRFQLALSAFDPRKVPFLFIGGRYGDWLWGLGRGDLLKEMVRESRQKGFIPLFSAHWATFALPKAKHLDVAAYAVIINKKKAFFDFDHACKVIKTFEKPIISLDPLAEGRLFGKAEKAFSFLFQELKVHSAVVEVASASEAEILLKAIQRVPSLIPFRKT